jgi:hypothetical protein
MKLLAVGTVAFDAIETPFGKTDKILGGAATYIGLAASVMKTDVSLVSVIGGDFPQHYLDMMTSKGINIDGVEMIKDGKTFFWSGKYHNDLNSRDTLATELNVLENFDPKIPESAKDAEVLLLDDAFSAIDVETEAKLIERLLLGDWKNKTILMSTHRLTLLPYAHKIIFMKQGTIKKVGTYQSLLQEDADFRYFTQQLTENTKLFQE